ncbi:hypothetical protein B0F90DRAFT_1728705 [Multifurca ochricompacta]|uniref:Secreted protein n=1 Tax=Multifurca ochricompacta TaxID=376703 RepID=A0AAD4M295_9AGAM|nr:hypothetical protein B0F90DRAFT_1728705 [Multifurca ochricompacta]
MSCQYNRLPWPQALLYTLASFLFFFASQASAAPHSNLARRGNGNDSSTKIIVRPCIIHPIPRVLAHSSSLAP